MSTYTDLHNKVKESIVVNCHRGFQDDRESYQEVKLLNPNNIYRGKFYGSLNAENTTIVGGELSNVKLTDVTLTGKVILPSGLDLAKLGNDVALISTDLTDTRNNQIPTLDNAIRAEEAARIANDTYLSNAIKSTHIDVENRLHDLSVELISEDARISSELTAMLSDETSERKLNDLFLSGSIDTVDLRLNKEICDRSREDLELNKLIETKESESISRDLGISADLSTHIEDNVRQFAELEESLLSNFNVNKHYMIKNSGNEGFYPYKAKDYCVNIFDLTLPEGTVYYKDGLNNRYDIGRIDLENTESILPLTFKTHQIESDEVLSTLKEDYPYVFKAGDLQQPTEKNSYVIEFNPYTETTVDLSTQLEKSKFTVKSEFETYHLINLYDNITKVKTNINIGMALRTFESGFNANILSGKFTIATSEPDLRIFNCEDIPFNTTTLSTYSYNVDPAVNRVTYLGENIFKLEKNINAERYIALIDTLDEDTHCHFGNIYENYAGLPGIISDDIGIKQINARVFNPYNVGMVALNRDDNYYGIIKDDIVVGDVSSTMILSANVTETSASFDIVNKAELYKYNYLGVNEQGTEEVIGYIVPTLYNKSIEAYDGYDTLSVNLSNLTWIDEFKSAQFNNGVFILKKSIINGLWTLNKPAVDSHNNTLEVKFNNSELYVRFTSYTQQQIIALKYKIDIGSKTIYNTETCHDILYRTRTINLGKFDLEIPTPEKTYYAKIEANEIDPNTSRYELKIDTSANDVIKIEIPPKDVKALSREFFAVFHIDTGAVTKLVKVEFIKKVDGVEVPVVIFNEDHNFLYLKSNRWTTLMINEIAPEKFLVTDLDNNVSDAKIKWLHDTLCTEIETRSSQVAYLSNNISVNIDNILQLSNDLSDLSLDFYETSSDFNNRISANTSAIVDIYNRIKGALSFQGLVDLDIFKYGHGDRYRESQVISNLLFNNYVHDTELTDHEIEELELSAGYYWLAVATENPLSTFVFEGLSVQRNDWLIVKHNKQLKNIIADDISIFDGQDIDVFHLSADNIINGHNKYFGLQEFDNISANVENVSTLSANVLTAEYGTIHNLTCDATIEVSGLGVNDLSAYRASFASAVISTMSVENNELVNAGISSLTATSSYISNDIVNNLSIASLTQLSILDKFTYRHGDPEEGIERISSLQDVLNLSVDNISAELNEVSTFIYDKHYAKTLSTDISCEHVLPGHTDTKVVDQLLILDEVTFDTYRLTIRNGALNINLVEKYTTK